MSSSYTKEYEINYHDADRNLNCKIGSIVNFLCDVGNAHSEALGDTIEKLISKNMAWVFYQYDIKMFKYPKYRDKVSITTESAGFYKFYAYRKYFIRDEKGELLGEALALFFLINIKRRRPMRIPEEEYQLYGETCNLKGKLPMGEVIECEGEDFDKTFSIRYSDIDSNGHVNNVNYIEWAIESVPVDVVKSYEVKRIKVVFEKETTYGDEVSVSAKVVERNEDKIIIIHTIKSREGKELTKLETTWERE